MREYVSVRRPPPVDFARPDGVVTAQVDPVTGMLARPGQPDAIEELFLPGTEPREIAIVQPDAGASSLAGFLIGGGDGGIPLESMDDEDAGASNGATSDDASAADPSAPATQPGAQPAPQTGAGDPDAGAAPAAPGDAG
jgi:penicillin-binding protein 1A